MSARRIVAQLRDAQAGQYPVRIERGHELTPNAFYGFVVGVSKQWVAVQALSNGVYIDGYDLVRFKDVVSVDDQRENGYKERALAILGRPAVDYALPPEPTTAEVLRSAMQHSPMIMVMLGLLSDSPTLVGEITELGARTFSMRLINPAGVWFDPTRWWYKDVTRVSFADRYTNALHRFGDPAPEPEAGPESGRGQPGVASSDTGEMDDARPAPGVVGTRGIVAQLRDAQIGDYPVRINRGHEVTLAPVDGFVVGVSKQWVAVQVLADSVHIEGYSLVRIKEIESVEDWRENGYIERALAILGRPAVDYVLPHEPTTADVLRSAMQHSPMISVEFELLSDWPMLVGKVTDLGARKFSMRLINSAGVWEPDPARGWYKDVTLVSFGDRYTGVLHRFGDADTLAQT